LRMRTSSMTQLIMFLVSTLPSDVASN
jgi:hypothetical protein